MFSERYVLMIPQTIEVCEGITLTAVQTKKFKTAALTLSLTASLTARRYLCGMLLGGVLRRGCVPYPSVALINRRLDELYAASAELQSSSGKDTLTLCLGMELIDSRFVTDGTDLSAEVINTAADILTRPLLSDGIFPADTVKSEIGIARDYLAAEKNNTRVYAATRLRELMHRYETEQPTLEYLINNVDSVTPEELTEFHRYMLTAHMNAFYIGAEDPSAIADKLRRAFDGRVGCMPPIKDGALPLVQREFAELSEDMPVAQGKLCMGFSTGATLKNGNHHTAIVLNELLGASPASKLFMNVRERLSLCYYCSSAYVAATGDMTVSSGLDPKNLDLAKSEILRQLDEIRNGSISDAEWTAARRSLEFTYTQIYDSPFALQGFYTTREAVGVCETVEECKAKILAVTKQEVCELAKRVRYDTCFFLNGTLGDETEVEYDDEE